MVETGATGVSDYIWKSKKPRRAFAFGVEDRA